MRNIISILFSVVIASHLSLNNFVSARPILQSKPIHSQVTQDKRLTTLHELFSILGITIEPTYEAMNKYAQEHWLRKAGQERWQMEPSSHQSNADKIIPSLKKLGLIDRIDPSVQNPDYAMVLGATVYTMRKRMQHMIQLINSGKFTPKHILILTGDRPLDPSREPESLLLDKDFIRNDWKCPKSLPTNETEAAIFVWDQLDKSPKVNAIPVAFVATPMLEKNGKLVRPTTVDTLETWIKTSPNVGSIVAFSDNPYIQYQNETMKPTLIKAGWFRKNGTFETVGLAFEPKSEKIDISILLDNLARYIYAIIHVERTLKDSN